MRITGGNALINAERLLLRLDIEEKMKIADLGCGISGHFVFLASKMVGKNGTVYAVDILKNVLENIEKRASQEQYENIKTVWTDLEVFGATKIPSNSLDAALLVNTLYQSRKRAEIIREATRMLKKGGKLLIVEWKNIASPFGPSKESRVKLKLLAQVAKKLGLDLEDNFEAGQFHYGLIFVK